eukprot:213098-Chlamydomonas_euryale.AAC.1
MKSPHRAHPSCDACPHPLTTAVRPPGHAVSGRRTCCLVHTKLPHAQPNSGARPDGEAAPSPQLFGRQATQCQVGGHVQRASLERRCFRRRDEHRSEVALPERRLKQQLAALGEAAVDLQQTAAHDRRHKHAALRVHVCMCVQWYNKNLAPLEFKKPQQ